MKPAFENLKGNDALRRMLGADIVSSRLSHAYILEGPKGCGKHTLAQQIAAAQACLHRQTDGVPLPCGTCPACQKILNGNSPDVIWLNKGEKATFGVETVRKLQTDVHIAPNELDTKTYILEDVHLMTAQAQNALLLTLEEPPPYVLFLLLTESAAALLETIRSRAPVRRMELLTDETISEVLLDRSPEAEALKRTAPNEFAELIAASGGRVGVALDLLDPKKRATVLADRDFAKRFLALVNGGKSGEVLALLSSAGQKREDLTAKLEFCTLALRDLILLKKSEQAPLCFFSDREDALERSDQLTVKTLLNIADAVETALERLRANGNTRLVLTSLGVESGLLSI